MVVQGSGTMGAEAGHDKGVERAEAQGKGRALEEM